MCVCVRVCVRDTGHGTGVAPGQLREVPTGERGRGGEGERET